MRNVLKIGAAAAITSAALAFSPVAATAGVVGLSDEQAVKPVANTDLVHWRPYCHHHWRHHWRYSYYVYPRYYGYWRPTYYGWSQPVYRYGYNYPYGYYGWGGGAAAATAAAADTVIFPFSLFTGW
ncbi:MAG TPA: hypothetical protein VK446_00145 [Methylocystis sp.]|nr:hypothetical protein [Methylocystis sp.]